MPTPGIEYEKFVQSLMQAIIDSESFNQQRNIIVEHNKKLIDRCGIERQFDIYWEYEQAGFIYKVIIECKDYNSAVSIEKIDALKGKMDDFPGIRGIIATKIGYQSGAERKAIANNIDILRIREQNDTDWEDENGNPLIKQIELQLIVQFPAHITKVQTFIDPVWLKENPGIMTDEYSNVLNNQVVIEDLVQGKKYSMMDLANTLTRPEGKDYEEPIKFIQDFENAFIINEASDCKLKIKKLEIIYYFSRPTIQTIKIDGSSELIGVVEYLNRGYKKMITKNMGILDRPLPKNN